MENVLTALILWYAFTGANTLTPGLHCSGPMQMEKAIQALDAKLTEYKNGRIPDPSVGIGYRETISQPTLITNGDPRFPDLVKQCKD